MLADRLVVSCVNPKPVAEPAWAAELLTRLQADKRFSDQLKGVRCWADLPIATQLPDLRQWRFRDPKPTRCYLSSGTRGEPNQTFFSAQDWRELVDERARCLSAVGVTTATKALVAVPFGPWFSGDNLSDALSSLGARLFTVGAYLPHLLSAVCMMTRLQANTLITLPSTALTLAHLAQQAQDNGLLSKPIILDRIIMVGESASEPLRLAVERAFGGPTQMLFAASEAVIGYEDPLCRGLYRWDPSRLHLEVLQNDGGVAASGEGELLVSRRGGEAMPIMRYALGDKVNLLPSDGDGAFRFLGRIGGAFQLPAGVQVDFPLLEAFLDSLRPDVKFLHFVVDHKTDGTVQLTIQLDNLPPNIDTDNLVKQFTEMSIDIADVKGSGFLDVNVSVLPWCGWIGKAIKVRETWQ